MSNAIIKIENLKKQYENEEVVTPVLFGLDFVIKKGEFVAIMGPSGSGKSTLMHILGFLDKLSTGKYLFEDVDVSGLDDEQLAEMRGHKIGFVFQSFNLLPRTSVLENVMLPLVYTKLSQAERVEKAKKAIEAVGLTHRINNLSNQLSGGEKQRVAIARALVNDPSVIFADEPTGNLDSKSGLQIMKILQELNLKQGHTIILVTHEKYTAEHAERIIKMRDGLIESDEAVKNRLIAERVGELK
ncbi:MAG: antimicrobial peptide ABC transporter ATPase [Candidatus Magasanikbacteria bacterium GW2011_GWC2_37_14]|uniref:Antimicrobial peptide ABC transporter ATPase n=1 Tax=Candidatus Magasanikbacteria bacterium GW2011_GWC2_37_14 TaxID=1619046 RepID=A0A0G0GPY8_9BACT|nr:MAG: antimicrobial peptide ABC transporter ATPase [Candidatus Magasanikbacteria bacterium GW2011_GWC2_37_14]